MVCSLHLSQVVKTSFSMKVYMQFPYNVIGEQIFLVNF